MQWPAEAGPWRGTEVYGFRSAAAMINRGETTVRVSQQCSGAARRQSKGVVTMKTLSKAVLLVAAVAAFAACNTVQGVGKDITSAGKGVQDQINKPSNDNK